MKRGLSVLATLAFAGATIGALALPAGAAIPAALPSQQFKGYTGGQVVHVAGLQTPVPGQTLATADIAVSGATVGSQGTATPINNEMAQVIQPALPGAGKLQGNKSYGKGSGVEVGLGQATTAPPQIALSQKAVSAPPDNHDDSTLIPIPANPLITANVVRGVADAHFPTNTTQLNGTNNCAVGKPYGQGLGYVADAKVLDPGAGTAATAPTITTDAPQIDRNVSQSYSNERLTNQVTRDASGKLVPGGNGNLALMSETRQTIAPVSIGWVPATPATPAHPQLTIEVGGEWVLQSIAGGVGGTGVVQYGPDPNTSPTTPVLRVFQYDAVTGQPTLAGQLLFQDITGKNGVDVDIPPGPTGPYLAHIHLATQPHKIGALPTADNPPEIASDGTYVAAAVDVLRVSLADALPQVQVADLRLGHMEAVAQVAPGGISCPLDVRKTSDRSTVTGGQGFNWKLEASNPYPDCTISHAKVTDTITPDPGVKYSVASTTPPADSTSPNQIVWNDVGAIPVNSFKTVGNIAITVDPASASGLLRNSVRVDGPCAGNTSGFLVTLSGTAITTNLNGVGANNVRVNAAAVKGTLAATGNQWPWIVGVSLMLIALAFAGGWVKHRAEPTAPTA